MAINSNYAQPLSAETLAHALDGKRVGKGWMARCPAHDDHDPSLSISDNPNGGNPLVRCHADCSQEDVLDALRQRGLWASGHKKEAGVPVNRRAVKANPDTPTPDPEPQALAQTKDAPHKKTKEEFIQKIWDAARPATDTKVSVYLESRGITIEPPDSLRFHPNLKHSDSGRYFPAMVGRITRSTDGEPLGIHRTFLAEDGKDKAPVESSKMMLGPVKGGVVRLGEPGDDGVLMIGEGIETCLSAMRVMGYPAWAALSASTMDKLDLPPGDYKVIVLADGDDAGEKAAVACANRWVIDEKRYVSIARPPRGKDFNDMLLDHLSDHKGNGATQHPILEIINAAEEIRDPIDELIDEVKNGTLTPEKLFSQKNIEQLARRCEEDDGQAFYEGFRNKIRDAGICRVAELDKAINKQIKEIRAERETPAMLGSHKFEDGASMSSIRGNNGESEIRVDPDALGGSWKDDPIMGGKRPPVLANSGPPKLEDWMEELQKKINKKTPGGDYPK